MELKQAINELDLNLKHNEESVFADLTTLAAIDQAKKMEHRKQELLMTVCIVRLVRFALELVVEADPKDMNKVIEYTNAFFRSDEAQKIVADHWEALAVRFSVKRPARVYRMLIAAKSMIPFHLESEEKENEPEETYPAMMASLSRQNKPLTGREISELKEKFSETCALMLLNMVAEKVGNKPTHAEWSTAMDAELKKKESCELAEQLAEEVRKKFHAEYVVPFYRIVLHARQLIGDIHPTKSLLVDSEEA